MSDIEEDELMTATTTATAFSLIPRQRRAFGTRKNIDDNAEDAAATTDWMPLTSTSSLVASGSSQEEGNVMMIDEDNDTYEKELSDTDELPVDDKVPESQLSESLTMKTVAAVESVEEETVFVASNNCDVHSEMKEPSTDEELSILEPVLLDLDAVLESTDLLFEQVDDKHSVTVKDIVRSLQAEFGQKLTREAKAAVIQRLTELITAGDDEQQEENSSVDEEHSAHSTHSASDSDDAPSIATRRRAPKSRSAASTRPRTSSKQIKHQQPPYNNKKKETSAMRAHAEKLRRRRADELRVRNEELQTNEADQQRAGAIALKFETNTDEQRLHRLEQRVDLLRRLDAKRVHVLEQTLIKEVTANKNAKNNDSSSSDEDELEVVTTCGKQLVVPQLQQLQPRVLDILDAADCCFKRTKKQQSSSASPSRARANLKNLLRGKNRGRGNAWLARELGYRTEQEHVQDCWNVEARKRAVSLKREQERVAMNQLRAERLLLHGEDDDDDEEEFEMANEEPVDEEVAMANAIEKEQQSAAMAAVDNATAPFNNDNDAGDNNFASDHDDDETMDQFETQLPVATTATLPSIVQQNAALESTMDNDDSLNLETQAPFVNETMMADATSKVPTDTDMKTHAILPNALKTEQSEHVVVDVLDETQVHEQPDIADQDADKDTITEEKPKGPRNSAWQAMLRKEAADLKKKRRKNDLFDDEADEEEEEEIVGLEDFGFTVNKEKNADDDDEDDGELDEDDLKNVVDELSDNEGDEEAGETARVDMLHKEDKERHKEILRRMREGYDGRRGGIALGGAGARGMHRFDQLVAADNREDAKRLGLLNDDELDSDQEEGEKGGDDEEEDEVALLDKMLKDRFLHRSSADVEEENFSDDDEDVENIEEKVDGVNADDDEKEQERLAKRFAKRARMQRLLEAHGHEEEFSRSRLIDDDEALKAELQNMKNGLAPKRSHESTLSARSSCITGTDPSCAKKPKTTGGGALMGNLVKGGGSLSIALQASRRNNHNKTRTSFLRVGSVGTNEATATFQKSIGFNHVIFQTNDSRSSGFSKAANTLAAPLERKGQQSSSLWSQAVTGRFQKTR